MSFPPELEPALRGLVRQPPRTCVVGLIAFDQGDHIFGHMHLTILGLRRHGPDVCFRVQVTEGTLETVDTLENLDPDTCPMNMPPELAGEIQALLGGPPRGGTISVCAVDLEDGRLMLTLCGHQRGRTHLVGLVAMVLEGWVGSPPSGRSGPPSMGCCTSTATSSTSSSA